MRLKIKKIINQIATRFGSAPRFTFQETWTQVTCCRAQYKWIQTKLSHAGNHEWDCISIHLDIRTWTESIFVLISAPTKANFSLHLHSLKLNFLLKYASYITCDMMIPYTGLPFETTTVPVWGRRDLKSYSAISLNTSVPTLLKLYMSSDSKVLTFFLWLLTILLSMSNCSSYSVLVMQVLEK